MQDYTELLLKRRNADGGWGYYPGKSSWLEPTAYAAIALHGRQESTYAVRMLQSWQVRSGAWVADPITGVESWATALVLVLKGIRGEYDESWSRGMKWLLETKGKKVQLLSLVDRLLGRKPVVEQDESLTGWPWMAGTSNWVEPTAHALRALRISLRHGVSAEAQERIRDGELLLLDRRCKDDGWNFGTKRVLGQSLSSFPECTALALIGLYGIPQSEIEKSIQCIRQDWAKPQMALARAMQRIALRMHGIPFEDRRPEVSDRSETTQIALSLIGEPEGTWRHWRGDA